MTVKRKAKAVKVRTSTQQSTANPPRALGAQVDKLFQLGLKISEQQQSIDKLKRMYSTLEQKLLRSYESAHLTGAQGKLARMTYSERSVPKAADWLKFWAYARKTNAHDLVQKRIAPQAWADRVAEGERVPGVEVFKRIALSVHALKKGARRRG